MRQYCFGNGVAHSISKNVKQFCMKKNMGIADRTIRILLAIVFAYLYFAGVVTGTIGLILVILGGVFVLTSLIGFCPLYTIFRINTCPVKKIA